ncbi:MAG: hypothetical protein HKK67_05460 [Chlorobiaceae bacterium]|nr:hypothetical protein [Chlorobiaceae bacterium]
MGYDKNTMKIKKINKYAINTPFINIFINIFCISFTIIIVGLVLLYSRYGIDFTDEGYYLVSISNPFIFNPVISMFGYIYYPLYKLVSEDIALLRQVNIIITYTLAWIIISCYLKSICSNIINRLSRLIISAAIATISLVSIFLNGMWLPTPSYNSLTFQALLITGIGLLNFNSDKLRVSLFGWIAIGIGGWLTFMGKPTSGIILFVGICVYIIFTRNKNWRFFSISICTALLLLIISGFVIDGSVFSFINRYDNGIKLMRLLDANYTATEAIVKLLKIPKIIFSLACVAIFITLLYLKVLIKSRALKIIGLAVFGLIFIGFLFLIFGISKDESYLLSVEKYLVWSLPCLSICFVIVILFNKHKEISLEQLALPILFLVFPHIYVFGTDFNYWVAARAAAFFWLISFLMLLVMSVNKNHLKITIISICVVVQLLTVAIVVTGLTIPYRQPQSLFQNSYSTVIGKSKSTLILSNSSGQYIDNAIKSAKKAKFKEGTSVIDLTGRSPGMLYALGANSTSQAWIIGGYKGSNQVAEVALKKVSAEELASAWLLFEPSGPRSISIEVLKSFGADFNKDYEVVASWMTANKVGGYEKRQLQQLLKPIRSFSTAIEACKAKRKAEMVK